MPRTVQFGLAAVAVLGVLLLAGTDWTYEAQAAVFVGVAAMAVLVGLRFQRRLPRGGPEPTGPDEVMPGARAFVDEFERAGFRRVGGFRWALRGRLVISTVLATPERDRYAIVTDRVLEIASRFGGRMLTTTNSGRAPVPDDVLRQVVAAGRPSELIRAHQDGLDRLADERLRPVHFLDDEDVLRFVREVEEGALRQARIPSLPTMLAREWGAEDDPLLGSDDASLLRIDTWRRGAP